MSDYIPPTNESNLNRLCRENKDIMDRGAMVGIFLCLLLIVYCVSNIMVHEQVKWVQEVCPCYTWGGNAFQLDYQANTTGVLYGGPTG